MTETDTLADSIFLSFKAYCAKEVERRVTKSHEDLLARIAEIPAGKDGAPGPQGEAGKDGVDGIDGKDGTPGRDGVDGKDGAPGERGADGINGKDGRDGVDGKDGAAGLDGKDGADGLNGKDGAPGQDGTPGLKGIDGRDGRDGLEGPPGRDALRLEVLDAIDIERSYPRNTYASHDGGMICAVRPTDPVVDGDIFKAGWKVIVRGIASEHEELLDDGRTIERVTFYTDSKYVRRHKFKVMVNRGVWKSGAEYEPGDVVTWGGSSWHCLQATKANPQEVGCEDWNLIGKRGRDGENGKPGERGMQGLPGKPGRDFTNLGTPIT